MTEACGTREDRGAQRTGIVKREELKLELRVRRPGHLDRELGHGENAGGQWLRHVDGLQPAQLNAALLLGDDAGVDPEVAVVVEPVPAVAPPQIRPACDHDGQHQQGEDEDSHAGQAEGGSAPEAHDDHQEQPERQRATRRGPAA